MVRQLRVDPEKLEVGATPVPEMHNIFNIFDEEIVQRRDPYRGPLYCVYDRIEPSHRHSL